ncbi:MAG: bifunctional diaminohydroxyphosphoribosylaminopyrimidine deaminase/5-amino-6-(5-phosphoribosylamino)uracil reductase RibD [Pelagibacteraceae bacterium]|nr:bifunctional diaminohydroxyphosphoribosylaminopyrimidine deaminase/5-amino-6-(5-phosphoribosylamino)uracil reductase RibD [Pelagibacteraceae bacterium]
MSTKKDKFSKLDIKYMKLALVLASARQGLTGTNPSVGCLIVKNNKIISIGQTGFNGRPHAEFNAIKNTNENLNGAKIYITLEPCNHYGRTPPCTNSIIKSKIGEVIYSINDIDKKVRGKSLKILQRNNIIVKKGLLKISTEDFYKPYFFNRKKKMPYVTGKIAISKNNLIFSKGTPRITDKYSDKLTHLLRYKNDSLLISKKTLNIDNPKLNCRLKSLNKFSPNRVVLDNNLETNNKSYIFKTSNPNNTIFFYNKASKSKILTFKKKKIKIIKSNLSNRKYFDLKQMLKKLYNIGCRNLLVEGGNDLTISFLKKKLFNEFYLFKSPIKLSKFVCYKNFDAQKLLSRTFKKLVKINTKLGKDKITLYRN